MRLADGKMTLSIGTSRALSPARQAGGTEIIHARRNRLMRLRGATPIESGPGSGTARQEDSDRGISDERESGCGGTLSPRSECDIVQSPSRECPIRGSVLAALNPVEESSVIGISSSHHLRRARATLKRLRGL